MYWWRRAALWLHLGFYEPENGLNKCFWRVYTLEQTRPRFQKFKRLVKYHCKGQFATLDIFSKRLNFGNDDSARKWIFLKYFLFLRLCSFDHHVVASSQVLAPLVVCLRGTLSQVQGHQIMFIFKSRSVLFKGLNSQNYANVSIICPQGTLPKCKDTT